MAFRTLTYALAVAGVTAGAAAQAAAPVAAFDRNSSPVEGAEQLAGGTEWIPAVIAILAMLSILLFEGDGDDAPVSP